MTHIRTRLNEGYLDSSKGHECLLREPLDTVHAPRSRLARFLVSLTDQPGRTTTMRVSISQEPPAAKSCTAWHLTNIRSCHFRGMLPGCRSRPCGRSPQDNEIERPGQSSMSGETYRCQSQVKSSAPRAREDMQHPVYGRRSPVLDDSSHRK